MTGLHVLEVEWMGLRTTWPPLVGWSLRLTREARVVQVVQGKHFVHTHTHTHTHTPHIHADVVSPHMTLGAPLSYMQSSGKMAVPTLSGSVWSLARR